MGEWRRVKWSEAGQITAALGWQETAERAALAPAAYFDALKRAARPGDAVRFLALALPRFETVTWSARVVRASEPAAAPDSAAGTALKAALLWLQNPVEGRRRGAFDAAQAAANKGAEAMAALAVFYSGGSVAPENCEPLPAPPHAAGRLAASDILLAAARSSDADRLLHDALALGETLAADGSSEAP
jgi:hypothetical protein